MIIKIVDNQWIYLDHITDQEEQVIWESFSVSKPNAYIDPNMLGNWDGIYRKYNRAKKRMARPLLALLQNVCDKHDLPYTIQDLRDPWSYEISESIQPDILEGITLASYQIAALEQVLGNECGIIEAPTGSGKGEIICGICKAISCPTVILADQRVVVDQLKRRLELRDIAPDIGLFYAGKKPDGQTIVVGLIQSLNAPSKAPDMPSRMSSGDNYEADLKKWDKKYRAFRTRQRNTKQLLAYVKAAEMIIVDECDRAASENYKNLFKFHYKGRRRYGLSATPMDPAKPVEALVVQEHLGSIIYKETRETVLEHGRIIPCVYNMLAVGLDQNPNESSAYDIAYKEWIVENSKLHSMILALAKKFEGTGTLILVDRKELGLALNDLINNSGIESHFIYGETPKKIRDEVLKRFEKREFQCLIGGKIINRGLDLSGGCENLILVGGGKLQTDLIQKVGRALRLNSKGHSNIYDFYFRCNRYLYNHSRIKLRSMVDLGFQTRVVFPGGSIDGREFVRKRFRIDKRFYHPRTTSR